MLLDLICGTKHSIQLFVINLHWDVQCCWAWVMPRLDSVALAVLQNTNKWMSFSEPLNHCASVREKHYEHLEVNTSIYHKTALLATPTKETMTEKWNVNMKKHFFFACPPPPPPQSMFASLHTHVPMVTGRLPVKADGLLPCLQKEMASQPGTNTLFAWPFSFHFYTLQQRVINCPWLKLRLQLKARNFQPHTDPLYWATDAVDEDVESPLLDLSVRQHFRLSQPYQYTATKHGQNPISTLQHNTVTTL